MKANIRIIIFTSSYISNQAVDIFFWYSVKVSVCQIYVEMIKMWKVSECSLYCIMCMNKNIYTDRLIGMVYHAAVAPSCCWKKNYREQCDQYLFYGNVQHAFVLLIYFFFFFLRISDGNRNISFQSKFIGCQWNIKSFPWIMLKKWKLSFFFCIWSKKENNKLTNGWW